jgi:hypothetical protein
VPLTHRKQMVGLGRLELPTSPLSGVRSSHLSYRPNLLRQKVLAFFLPSSKSRSMSIFCPVWIKIQRTLAKSRRFTAFILSSARE